MSTEGQNPLHQARSLVLYSTMTAHTVPCQNPWQNVEPPSPKGPGLFVGSMSWRGIRGEPHATPQDAAPLLTSTASTSPDLHLSILLRLFTLYTNPSQIILIINMVLEIPHLLRSCPAILLTATKLLLEYHNLLLKSILTERFNRYKLLPLFGPPAS